MSSNELRVPTDSSTAFVPILAISPVGVSTIGRGLKNRYVRPVATTVPATKPPRIKFRRFKYTCSGVISLEGGSGNFLELILTDSDHNRFGIHTVKKIRRRYIVQLALDP